MKKKKKTFENFTRHDGCPSLTNFFDLNTPPCGGRIHEGGVSAAGHPVAVKVPRIDVVGCYESALGYWVKRVTLIDKWITFELYIWSYVRTKNAKGWSSDITKSTNASNGGNVLPIETQVACTHQKPWRTDRNFETHAYQRLGTNHRRRPTHARSVTDRCKMQTCMNRIWHST